jgi:hypothetical protein
VHIIIIIILLHTRHDELRLQWNLHIFGPWADQLRAHVPHYSTGIYAFNVIYANTYLNTSSDFFMADKCNLQQNKTFALHNWFMHPSTLYDFLLDPNLTTINHLACRASPHADFLAPMLQSFFEFTFLGKAGSVSVLRKCPTSQLLLKLNTFCE